MSTTNAAISNPRFEEIECVRSMYVEPQLVNGKDELLTTQQFYSSLRAYASLAKTSSTSSSISTPVSEPAAKKYRKTKERQHKTSIFIVRLLEEVRKVSLRHYKVGENLFLTLLNGKNDSNLLKWAKWGFGRGFPIIWGPNRFEGSSFFPKFDNDDTDFDFDGIRSMYGFRKWSGFLTSLIIWSQSDGTLFWTTTSKKASQNEFSRMAYDGWCEILTPSILCSLHKAGICSVWAERMDKNDPFAHVRL